MFKRYCIPDCDRQHGSYIAVFNSADFVYVEAAWGVESAEDPISPTCVFAAYDRKQALQLAWALIVCVVAVTFRRFK